MHIQTLKQKNGTVYRVHVKSNGVTKSKMFKRKHDAMKWGEKTEAFLTSGARVDLTFRELAEEWIENHCKVHNVAKTYEDNISKLDQIYPFLGDVLIQDISFVTVELLTSKLFKAKKRKAITVNRFLSIVRCVLNYGVKKGDLHVCPIKRHHFLPEEEVEMRYWSQAEAETFLEYTEKKYAQTRPGIHLLYVIALNTGMRWGEIVGLHWDCVFFGRQPYITVKRVYCTKTRKMREHTKSRRIRYIGMNHVLLQALQKAYRERGDSRIVVKNTAGNIWDNRGFYQRIYKKDIAEAGLSDIRFHDLRHTYAANFMMNGGSVFDLQKILGHQDIQTTMNYSHFSKEYIIDKSDVVVFGDRNKVIEVDFKKQVS
ncbi:MAG: hypothetical protein COX62_05825 [Deltaproteobacteria bacterium CG_4_10_14_0_2_um_filter_43_8]|nr:MAG: hypothetical protein COV43_08330 [Deltaproteobacteria bacterium CG11_big_fil_rev_8_21_14_0_20_42_23]PJA19879.1 MAG: hypothetical protein COX62_05825 [Deltaproteobacteria bacterium CG_4_10_14_0_2_um_filter_43_8]PJC63402.1 MAG: hypothetical protein CO021_09545 [Deltaproteobacteria bacterium CG_4_9_14_0_2_um_filter_42_21]